MKRKLFASLAMCVATLGVAHADYPDHAITMVVPFPPGGPTDAVARSVAQALGKQLNVSIIVDNRGGAGGTLATGIAASSKPDGYTIFFATTGTMAINPALYKAMRVDPVKAFVPVGTVAQAANVLVVSTDAPYANLKDLIAAAKKAPGTLTFASSGNGGVIHLTGEQFKKAAGLDITHIPYKGSAPAMTDLMSQRVTMMFDIVPGSAPFITGGKLKALAVTSKNRVKALPNIPTMAEAGMPGFEATSWFGIVAPTGTPQASISRLSSALETVLANPQFGEQLSTLGSEVMPGTPQDFAAVIREDAVKWAALVKSSGATID